MKDKVSIILLNYNGKIFNKDCLDSILNQNYSNFEIIFVDNNSTDGSLEDVERDFGLEIDNGKIILVKSKKNLGFDGGNNLGVKYVSSDSKYVCLLNNDTIVEYNRLEELVKGIETDKKVGAVGSLVLNKGQEDYDYDNVFKYKLIPVISFFGCVLINNKTGNHDLIDVSNLSGCSLMYKKSLIDKPFEDYYFAYGEEPYLCRRMLYMGYSLKLCTKSIVHHYGGGTSKTISNFCLFHDTKNRIINHYLFLSWYNRILLLPLFLIKDFLQLFSFTYKYPLYILIYKIKSQIRFMKNFSMIKETKDRIQKKFVLSEYDFMSKISFKLVSINLKNRGIVNKLFNILISLINIFFETYGKLICGLNYFIIKIK